MMQSSMAVALAGFSFMLTVIWGPPLIRVLRYLKIGKSIRVEGPERHFTKLGTPTMGGVMFILPVILITVLMNGGSLLGITLLGRSVIVPLITMVLFAGLGAVDDWLGLRAERRAKGLSARTKMLFQIIFSVMIALALDFILDAPELFLPGIPLELTLGIWYVPIAAFVIVSMSNAINLTDGLDGLAGLISATAFATYGGIALLQGQIFLGRFCFTLVGAIFGFLWFNVHPAQLFMGDTGALSLGATLAVAALMTGQWILIPLIAVIPVSVVLSVVLQVGYFKLTGGKRLFKMAPLQHHFELLGWSETQVVQRFWLITLLFAMVGVALALV
ncbi:MAG: phospho-N-acetylmuramoyl-pentapeptide-transferase [Chloroflexi bacterium RBG_16_57_11]|nr:MAG: phospho-N-acetylmuramoyl-pentapeptide-transferase [Chloroflexi bacterium RBG_16_57_11]